MTLPTFDHLSDEELTRGVQQGEMHLFGLLVERYEDKMLRYARRFLFNQHDAEDAVQEVFLKAYINMRSFNSTRRFSPWLYRIAHNELLNSLRKKMHEPIPFFDPDTLLPHPVAREQTDQPINEKELKELISANLDKLPQKYREPLVLYYFQDLSYQEISDILQIPVSTVGVRISRAKLALRNFFTNSADIYEPRTITN